jgi:hypothetical protein
MDRVRSNETPVLFLYQDWALGMLALKVWARAMTVEAPFGLGERPMPAAAPGGWRARLERLARTPLRQLPFWWTLAAVIWPLVQARGSSHSKHETPHPFAQVSATNQVSAVFQLSAEYDGICVRWYCSWMR